MFYLLCQLQVDDFSWPFMRILYWPITLVYSPKSCFYHYMSMAKGNYREYLQGDIVRIKKYFYVLRPLLACKWIREKNSLPPMEFRKLVTELLPEGSLLAEINKLLQRKNRGDELDYEPRIPVINDFLEEQMHHFERSAKNVSAENPADNTLFNRIFREALDEVWVKTGRNHSDWART